MRTGQVLRMTLALAAVSVVLAGCSADGGDASEGSQSDPDATSESMSSRASVALPEKLGSLVTFAAACDSLDGDTALCLRNADERDASTQAAAANLADAYDGAATAAVDYASDGYSQTVRVLAVAADSPGLWTTDSEVEAERQALGHPQEWVERLGDAQCLARTESPVPADQTLSDDNAFPVRCQASGNNLTVIVFPGSDATIDEALGWTQQAYDAAT